MEIVRRHQRLFACDDWANRETLAAIAAAVWPDLGVAGCREALDDLARLWKEYLGALIPDGLDETVAYVNSKGEPWTSSVEDILTHTVLHSSYHRGQIAADMRASGHAPAYTDYIHARRQGFVE